MLVSRKSQGTIGGEEMKKKTLLKAIRFLLLIIPGASFIVAAFMTGTICGLLVIGCMSIFYLMILRAFEDLNKYG